MQRNGQSHVIHDVSIRAPVGASHFVRWNSESSKQGYARLPAGVKMALIAFNHLTMH